MENKLITSNSSTYRLGDTRIQAHNKLPIGVYTLEQNPMTGEYFLQKANDMKLPKKYYGTYDHYIKRWSKTWNAIEGNMGIILSGTKGTGKTLLAQKFCIESNMPVIIINRNYGQSMLEFLQSDTLRDSIIFIDEFEKIINQEDEAITPFLQLFDGSFGTRFCFILTCNEFEISKYLYNRLGRIRYRAHFTGLTDEIIEQVIDDYLINKTWKAPLQAAVLRIGTVTFDILMNLIQEVNIQDEDPLVLLGYLNLKQETQSYDTNIYIAGIKLLGAIVKDILPTAMFVDSAKLDKLSDVEVNMFMEKHYASISSSSISNKIHTRVYTTPDECIKILQTLIPKELMTLTLKCFSWRVSQIGTQHLKKYNLDVTKYLSEEPKLEDKMTAEERKLMASKVGEHAYLVNILNNHYPNHDFNDMTIETYLDWVTSVVNIFSENSGFAIGVKEFVRIPDKTHAVTLSPVTMNNWTSLLTIGMDKVNMSHNYYAF